MPDVRYLGSTHWTRAILDDDGKFKKFENVAPGEVVSLDEDVAERFLQGPRYNRLFVQAGGPEDPNSDDYVGTRRQIGDGGMYVSEYPGLEMGSTVQGGRTITRTEDDNEEQLEIAAPDEGPQSDNERLVIEDEIQAEAEEARRKARESRSSKRPSGSGQPGSVSTNSGDGGGRGRPSPQGGERSERPSQEK